MKSINTPRVFISHASEDKARFVIAFAENLRRSGIDAWLDKWEMLPGDSLVEKIFEEGLKGASAVIIVLSRFSVRKPWVREELNAAVVKRIATGSKLIPVVIDDCEIPEALKSTVWERIANVGSYQESLDRIVASIFGATDRPAIGASPSYTQGFTNSIGGLNNIDGLVLKHVSEYAISMADDVVDADLVFQGVDLDVPQHQLLESLEVLDQEGYIRISRVLGGGISHFRITIYGLEQYAKGCIPNYDEMVRDVVLALVNRGLNDNISVAADLHQPQLLVDHIFDVLEENGYITQSQYISQRREVHSISPKLKRSVR